MVLDIGLPSIDGSRCSTSSARRGSELPVIVLTARDSVTDTVSALEGGADDYMAKPFRFAELLARIQLRLRRAATAPRRDDVLEAAAYASTSAPGRATVGDKEVDLSAREFALAEILMTNAGQVLSREQLLDQVWGFDFDPGSNVVDVYVGYLRKKFGATAIATVRGHGLPLQHLREQTPGTGTTSPSEGERHAQGSFDLGHRRGHRDGRSRASSPGWSSATRWQTRGSRSRTTPAARPATTSTGRSPPTARPTSSTPTPSRPPAARPTPSSTVRTPCGRPPCSPRSSSASLFTSVVAFGVALMAVAVGLVLVADRVRPARAAPRAVAAHAAGAD